MYCSRCGTWATDDQTLCAHCGAALHVDLVPVTPAPSPVPIWQPTYAGFWRRFGTLVVDYVVVAPFTTAFDVLMGHRPFDPPEWNGAAFASTAFALVAGWLYSTLFESSARQGTLGQQLLGVRVTDLHGRRISFARATGRHLAQWLSVLTVGFGYLMIAFNARKQGLHDRVAGCLLIRPETAPRTVATPEGATA